MVNAQGWLDKNYPQEQRSEVKEIYLDEPSLTGELCLREFNYPYFNVKVSSAVNEEKLKIKNLLKHAKLIKLINAQKYVDQQYPTKEEKEKVVRLDISYENLEGQLDLSEFINLKELMCSYNKLTFLNLSNCPQLTEIYCYKNQLTQLTLPNNPNNLQKLVCYENLLTELDFSALNQEKLTVLKLQSNNLTKQDWDLNLLAGFTQLRILCLGNDDKKSWTRHKYNNHWTGSLSSLKHLLD